ncbi:MAG: hypothetical protein NVSMB31_03670 [Vulcanimicrobiaceae bacterium]
MKLFRSLAILPVLGLAFCAAAPNAAGQAAPRTVQLSASDASARIFVADRNAKAGNGPNGVPHGAGVRPGDDTDDGSQTVLAADATDLLVSLDKWRQAQGTAQIVHVPGNRDRVSLQFQKLIAFGVYSVFVADLNNPDSGALLALDGSGDANTFDAAEDGTGSLTVTTRDPLTSSQALILIYHSDDTGHGPSPGTIAVDAHEQIITHL